MCPAIRHTSLCVRIGEGDMMSAESIMLGCMQSNTYGENKGSGYTGVSISKCRECDARMKCSRDEWLRLGGKI